MDRKVKLNGVAIQGLTLTSPRTPNLIIGNDAGYIRGDILDANAVATKINEVIAGAPEALDTLKELADAMQDNPQLITDMKNQIDPFFTPNQNNKIDTYDELKAFFNDTQPTFTYAKDSSTYYAHMIYDSVNDRWTSSTSLDEFLNSIDGDRVWIVLSKNGHVVAEAPIPYNGEYDEEYGYIIYNGERIYVMLDVNPETGYGEVAFSDEVTSEFANNCVLYNCTLNPEFSTFEERMDGKVDSLHIFDESTQERGSIEYDDDNYSIIAKVVGSDESESSLHIEDGTVGISNAGFASVYVAGQTAEMFACNLNGQPISKITVAGENEYTIPNIKATAGDASIKLGTDDSVWTDFGGTNLAVSLTYELALIMLQTNILKMHQVNANGDDSAKLYIYVPYPYVLQDDVSLTILDFSGINLVGYYEDDMGIISAIIENRGGNTIVVTSQNGSSFQIVDAEYDKATGIISCELADLP